MRFDSTQWVERIFPLIFREVNSRILIRFVGGGGECMPRPLPPRVHGAAEFPRIQETVLIFHRRKLYSRIGSLEPRIRLASARRQSLKISGDIGEIINE